MKKNVKKGLAMALSLLAVLSTTACGGSTESGGSGNSGSGSGEDSYVIRFATNSSAADVQGEGVSQTGKGMIYFCKEIEERSGGRITTQIFTDGQLASSTQEYIGNAQAGAYEMFMLNCGSWADYTSAYAGLNVPYLYMDYDDAYAVLDSDLRKEWDEKAEADTQCIPLAHLDIGFRQLTANKEVHSPADMKGIKIRTMVDPIQTACWEALGASVTPVPYAELYTALQQGMVDAQENPPSNIVSSKLYELQKYCMKTNHNFTTTIMAASPVFWSQISDADKELIAQTWKDTEMYVRSLTSDLSDGFFQTMSENGTTVVELTPDELKEFQDVAKTVWPKIEESMGSEAYNKLIDFVMDYQANK